VRGRIFKRGDTWTFVVDVGLAPDGRRKQRFKGGFGTRRAAEEALRTVVNAVAAGEYIDPTKLSFEQYVQGEWLPALQATVRPLTWESYERHCHKYLVPAFGSYPLGGVPSMPCTGVYFVPIRRVPRFLPRPCG
jgi:hypothetical protein